MFKHLMASGIYTRVKRIVAVGLFLVIALLGTANAAHTRVSLLLSATDAKPGDTVLAAVRLQMDPGWHTYWRNGGDSGGPTKIEWQLPPGITAGEIQWPVPEKYVVEGLVTYVYHEEAMLLVPLKLANELKPGALELKAKVSWLECEKVCVPGNKIVSAALEIAASSRPSSDATLIDAAKAKLPKDSSTLGVRATWEKPTDENTRPQFWNGTSRARQTRWISTPKPAIPSSSQPAAKFSPARRAR
ncbi:MAG: protein-disulfide reductase DsbD family protein [Verrucomicrobiota bacterium]